MGLYLESKFLCFNKCIKYFGILFIAVSLQLCLLSETCVSNEQGVANAYNGYPLTPEGVVDAYCKADFNGGSGSWQSMAKFTFNEEPAGSDTTVLVSGYKIVKVKKTIKVANVRVIYKVIGNLYWDGERERLKPSKRKMEAYDFKLIKKNDLWKIENPLGLPHYSVYKIINSLKKEIHAKNNIQYNKYRNKLLIEIENQLNSLSK